MTNFLKTNCAQAAKTPSFKTATLIAAVGMIVYTLYITARYIIHAVHPMHYHFELWTDIRTRLMFDVLLFSLITACIALYNHRPVMSASKPFRRLTIALFIALIGTPFFCFPHVHICGLPSLFPSFYWRILMLIGGIVWLFMLRQQPTEKAASLPCRATLILAILILSLPIVLGMISGLSLWINGNILGLKSSAIKTWVRWLVPILPLASLVLFSQKK